MNENKKTYYIKKGGVRCDFSDCFACQNGKCTLLTISYKADEVCPFYKTISKEDVMNEALFSTYNYTIRRGAELNAQIKEIEQIIKEMECATKQTINVLKKDIKKKRVALQSIGKEQVKLAEKIAEQQEEEK